MKTINSRIDTDENKKFVILIWKYWKWLENRHVHNFDNKRRNNPLSGCSVNNCVFTGDDSKLSTADAVIIHVQRGIFPNTTERSQRQRWVFLNDESPFNAFSMSRLQPKISDLANIFNWSMTYRSDSDVPVPYGRTVPLQKPIVEAMTYENRISLVPNWKNKRRDVLVTILISNCGVSRRMNYLEQLQKHITVDVFGKCSKNHKESCPGHFRSDCNIMSGYLFYLVFENSECEEYLTEKSFYNAYSKGAIPVILGPTVENCELLLPPNSFLHIDNFESPEELAKNIIEISKDDNKLLSYHRWRNDFEVVNEHGYFGSKSYHLCRICEALNYNDRSNKVYTAENLRKYFDPKFSCR
ncbi:unnamed protein product, partial [Brenthis ino]